MSTQRDGNGLPPVSEWWKWVGAFLIGMLRAVPSLFQEKPMRPGWLLVFLAIWLMIVWLLATSVFGYNASDVTRACVHRGGVRQLVDETFTGGGGSAIVVCMDGSATHLGDSPVP